MTDTLIEFDYAAGTSLTPGTPVSSNPAVTCTVTPFGSPVNGAAVKCVGNLGPGQGVTITVPITSIVGDLFADRDGRSGRKGRRVQRGKQCADRVRGCLLGKAAAKDGGFEGGHPRTTSR